jgi:hypothetical protein
MLFEGFGDYGVGEEKLRIHKCADAAIHNELDRPAAGGVGVDGLFANFPRALFVDVVDLAALLVDDTAGWDVGPDHTLHSLQSLGLGEIERERDLREAKAGDGEIGFKLIMRSVVPRASNIDGNLYNVIPANVPVEHLAELGELKLHPVPDPRRSLLSSDVDVFCIFSRWGT